MGEWGGYAGGEGVAAGVAVERGRRWRVVTRRERVGRCIFCSSLRFWEILVGR